MNLSVEDGHDLDQATSALTRVKELIESAQLTTPELALRCLDEADLLINEAEAMIDAVHYRQTRIHGSEHLSFQFGQTGLALIQARQAVQTLREILLQAKERRG